MIKQSFKTSEKQRMRGRKYYRLKRLKYSWSEEQKMKRQLQKQQNIENGIYVPTVKIQMSSYILDFESI